MFKALFASRSSCLSRPSWLTHAFAVRIAAGCVLSIASLARAGDFGAENTIKVRVPATFLEAQLSAVDAASVKLVAQYGSFCIVEVPAGQVPAIAGAEVLELDNAVLLNTGALDTTTPAVKQLQQPRAAFAGKAMHIVQFAGPILPDWYDQLTKTGVEVVTYLPSNAYLVYGDLQQIKNLQALAAALPQIQWDGEYKIDPAAVKIMRDPLTAGSDTELFAIQLVKDPAANAQTIALLGKITKATPLQDYDSLNYHNIVIAMPPSMLPVLAAMGDVVSIQHYIMPTKNDERQAQISAGNVSGGLITGPGYLSFLSTRGFTQAQFTASGFAVDVSDSGIDNATTSPNHFGLYESGIRPGTSRVIYNRLVGTPNSGSTQQGCDGHGNLNSHIVAGYDNLSGFPFADSAGFHYGLGICPFVKVGSSVVFDPTNFTSPNYANLQAMAYAGGARISTNSWGSHAFGAYNTDSQSYDALVRDAQPNSSSNPALGNQEMVIVFSAGNDGSGAGSIGAPGTGKNVITVGAAENVQPFGGNDGSGVGDSGSNNANDIIGFSSRGPCTDGRKKPDIVAPGTHVSGGVAQTASPASTGTANACFTGSGVSGGISPNKFWPASQQFYTASSGTSHSCPGVAGGAALIRQFFINQGLSPATPAMTKAMLMNSARYMTGTGANDALWSNSQGMGEMNLGEAFNRNAVTPTIFRDEVAADMFTATGQTRVFTGSVADSTKPFRISLAWTDAPGSTAGSAFKNNLDLTVTVGGNTYKGNVFTGANSVTGGSADAADNAENVFLPAGLSGAFTVTVTAANINSDGVPGIGGALDQDFALVIYNGSSCASTAFTTQPNSQTVCAGNSVTFTVAASNSPTYQWRKNTVNIPGQTNPTYTISSPASTDAGSYDCVATNSCGSATSNTATLNVNNIPSISGHPQSISRCTGVSASFSVATSGATGFQWRKNLNNIGGATSPTYTISSPTTADAGSYDCVVSNTCGSLTSNAATLTVNAAPQITGQPSPVTVCANQPASFSVTATNSPTYQWRRNLSNIPGETSSSLNIANATPANAGSYDCVITNSCGTVTSNAVALTVNSAPGITQQPTGSDVCAGSPLSLSIAANNAPTYQWRRNLTDIPGATTSTYSVPAATAADAGAYDCIVSNTCGSIASDSVNVNVDAAPTISSQPVSASVCDGSGATFSVGATGTPAPSYQWTHNLADIPGATSSTYFINSSTSLDAGSYACRISNSCGTITSDSVTLTVNPGPSITQQPGNASACPGSPVTFTTSATGSPTYQWYFNNTLIPGATNPSYTIPAVQSSDAGNYTAVATNSCGTDTTSAATLTVDNETPAITTQPVSISGCIGQSATFSLVATNSPTYQWRKDSVSIPGATADTYIISLPGSGDAGSYDCIVSNNCGSVTSNAATFSICAADFNCSGDIDFFDYLDFVDAFSAGAPTADFNHDSAIDFFDYLDFVDAFSAGC